MISSLPTPVTLTPQQRSAFLDLVDREFGIRGSDYGASRVDEAVHKLLPLTACTTPDELLAILETDGQTSVKHLLVEHLTVGETYFLRDPAQIAALRETILPELIERRSVERRLRLWSAGCSTGEEPHTLAILLHELGVTSEWDVLLVGTDVNRASLRVAREGCYPAWSFRATSDEIRDRYFLPSDSGWRLIDTVRRMARFAWMNLGGDALLPPSTELDLIVCRNVTIYFDDAATQRLYRTLIRALAPGGWLMLGPSDPVPADRTGLERIEISDTVVWRRAARSTRGVADTAESTGMRGSARALGASEPAKRPPASEGEATAGVRRSTSAVGVSRAAQEATSSGTIATRQANSTSVGGSDAAQPETPSVTIDTTDAVTLAMTVADGLADLEVGLLALEAGASAAALDSLRRATFRDPRSPLAQFALARAYVQNGDPTRAHRALIQARRLLAPLDGAGLVPGSDALPVETLRQTIHTHLEGLHA